MFLSTKYKSSLLRLVTICKIRRKLLKYKLKEKVKSFSRLGIVSALGNYNSVNDSTNLGSRVIVGSEYRQAKKSMHKMILLQDFYTNKYKIF